MEEVPDQLSFLITEERVLLTSATAEIRYIPAVFSVQEAEAYFKFLHEGIDWEETTMWMYDRTVDVPRLISHYGADAALPPEVIAMQRQIEQRLNVYFNAVGMNLYRNEKDSVAWHSDKNEDLTAHPTVAILSFGATRPIMLREKRPPRHAIACNLEPGSALIMTGKAQDQFEHQIPKLPHTTGPRISVVFRTKRGNRVE